MSALRVIKNAIRNSPVCIDVNLNTHTSVQYRMINQCKFKTELFVLT